MPLIDITTDPRYRTMRKVVGNDIIDTDAYLVTEFGPELPTLFASNSIAFGMGEETPESGVQVQFHTYGPNDINTAEVWVKVQLSEEPPSTDERRMIRGRIFDTLVDLIHSHGLRMPDSFVLDVFWGPISGCGFVNETNIEW